MKQSITHKELYKILYRATERKWVFVRGENAYYWNRTKKEFYYYGYDSYNQEFDVYFRESVDAYEKIVIDGNSISFYSKYGHGSEEWSPMCTFYVYAAASVENYITNKHKSN